MLTSNLVSIISPCYNGEEYIKPFLDSILDQDYPFIELILIDDGSSDNTAAIISSYIEQFQQRGFTLHYFYKKNGGQASAINMGLNKVHGEFLMWMDSDDVLTRNSLSRKVEFLKANARIDFVICQGYIARFENLSRIIGFQKRTHSDKTDDLFADLITDKNVIFTPAAYMVRTAALFTAIPQHHIFESREGQNWQLLLPLAYGFKYGYIDSPLYKYVVRDQSHSHKYRDYQDQIRRLEGFEELQSRTIINIPNMSVSEKTYWLQQIHANINRKKMATALDQFHLPEWWKWYQNEDSLKSRLVYNPISFFAIKLIRKIKEFVKNNTATL